MILGAHMKGTGGLASAISAGAKIGCDAVQVFTKNPQRWRAKALTEEEIAEFGAERERTGIEPVVAHDTYLINLASPDEMNWRKSFDAFVVEIERCDALRIPFLVTHMGAHRGSGDEEGLRRLSESLNRALERTEGAQVEVVLENTAGQGTSLGYRFEHLAEVLAEVERSDRMGACFDTCHAFAAGYDLRTDEAYTRTFEEFDRTVGLHRLRVIHVNDAKREFGSRVDRHEHIGEGELGLEPFRMLVNDPRFQDIPLLLETPDGEEHHGRNLKRLRGLWDNK